ncbi:MAG: 30S ribosomal protein S6 [Spirochaetia bacterium]|nr:30S ribosomal protein S6 [Spirochaetia bacterium]
MKTYELTIIFKSSDEDFKNGKELIEAELAKYNVSTEKEEDLGIKVMAYPIKKEDKGHYLYKEISANPENIINLEKAFRLMPQLLKFLFVKKDD